MIVNHAALTALTHSLKTSFQNALESTPTVWEKLATRVPSTNASEDYGWFGELPKMKEWLGERELGKLRAHTYNIRNKKWANGVIVGRDEIEDDQTGLAALRAAQLGEMAAQHKDELLFDLIASGFTTTCYDGQYFFDTDHGDSADKSNKGTAALAVGAYETAMKTMELLTDDNGEPLSVRPNVLLCGPKLRVTATEILKQRVLASGEENIHYGELELMISPRLVGDYDDYWFLLKTDGIIKPFIMQDRRPVRFQAMTSMDDEAVFSRDDFRYGADARYNAGFGLWQLAWGSDGSA